jgi:hypothetical protein
MRQRSWLQATIFSMTCAVAILAAVSILSASIAVPAASTAITPTRTAKCTIEIADGKGADCTLVKANHEWILWSNSASHLRSVHFKSDDNPFMEASCWDVAPGARARSGPIALNAASKAYFFYSSGAACDSKPPSDAKRAIARVIVQ